MEDVLDVYARPYDEKRPVVCLDEGSKELHGEQRRAIVAEPGTPTRADYEYVRNGTASIFVAGEPLAGKRRARVTEHRTRKDWAEFVRDLLDEDYPLADKVVLVQDNLNTHTPGSLYETFPPAEAKRLCDRIEWHYTPKHGSWLNVAEIELRVLSTQCLSRRLPDRETLAREVAAWEKTRNASDARIDWQFTTKDARIKLKRLYPQTQA